MQQENHPSHVMRVVIFWGACKCTPGGQRKSLKEIRVGGGRSQADRRIQTPALCICVCLSNCMRQKDRRIRSTCRSNQSTKSPSLFAHWRFSLTLAMRWPLLPMLGTRCVCVWENLWVCEIFYLRQNMDEEMEMRELQSTGLSHTGYSNG